MEVGKTEGREGDFPQVLGVDLTRRCLRATGGVLSVGSLAGSTLGAC